MKCLRLLQASHVPTSLQKDLDELLAQLPPSPRRWTKTPSSAARDIQSMPPNSNIEDCAPVRPPRHTKLKKMASSGNSNEDIVRICYFY